jgi:glutathione-regulated potassium-efflux system ancillary protein KefG
MSITIAGIEFANHSCDERGDRKYEDMPRPVIDLGQGRVKLWLRPQIERWAAAVTATGRTRSKRRSVR